MVCLCLAVGGAALAFSGSTLGDPLTGNGELAFDNGFNSAISVVASDGSGLTQIQSNASFPRWSPDGSKIAFMSNRSGDISQVFVMDAAGNNVTQVTNSAPGADFPSFTPDGASILYSENGAIMEIPASAVNGSPAASTLVASNTAAGPAEVAAESSDGTKIAFSGTNGCGQFASCNLWLYDTTTQALTSLTSDSGDLNEYPAWSPDGSRIYFQHLEAGSYSLRWVAATGGPEHVLPVGVYRPAPSPDGTRLAYSTGTGIGISDTNGGSAASLNLSNTTSYFDLAWQPVGLQTGPTFTVTNTGDANGGCSLADCSLREAITALNTSAAAGTIGFSIPGSAPHVIQVGSALPTISEPVTVNGLAGGSPGVVIDGSSITEQAAGLTLGPGSDGSTVEGLVVQHFHNGGPPSIGIDVQSDGNTLEDLYVGTSADGLSAAPNDNGIQVEGGSNHIGIAGAGNVISGNFANGVLVAGGSSNVVAANLIGTDVSGNVSLPNDTSVEVSAPAIGTTIGGGNPADGNVAYGSSTAINVDGPGAFDGAVIESNLVGVGQDGTTAFPNSGTWAVGVSLADNVTVANNVITHGESGLAVDRSQNISITGNFVGVDEVGGAQPNTYEGIYLSTSSVIPVTGASISGNTVRLNPYGGIDLATVGTSTVSDNVVSGNGVDGPANDNSGIFIDGSGNTIGPGNTITGNGDGDLIVPGAGVTIANGSANTITQNSIDGNAGLGIDLANDGVSANGQAGFTGPNNYEPFPVISSATVSGQVVHVTGSLTTNNNATYTLEFFASPAADSSGNGEGALYVGSAVVLTQSGTNIGNFDAHLTAGTAVPAGYWVSAVATAPDGSTSEFSHAIQSQAGADTGQVSITPEADTYVARGAPTTNFGLLPYADSYGGNTSSCVLANGTSYALMRFDLSSIPAGAQITHVELDTTTRAGWAQNGDPDQWALYLPNDTWGETTTTWNNRPSDGTTDGTEDEPPTVRSSSISNGAANVFRATCGADPAANQSIVFPSDSDGILPVTQAETNFTTRIQSKLAPGGDGKLSLELWQPNCLSHPGPPVPCDPGGSGYWARYWTREASDPTVRPKLVVQYTFATPPIDGNITLSGPATAAAAGTVPLASIPPSAFFGAVSSVTSAPVGSVPVGSVPLASVPLASVPVGSVPVGSVPLASVATGTGAGAALLGSIALSTIPLAPPYSWAQVLAGTPLATLPLQSVTLAQVLQDPTAAGRLNAAPLASVDLSRSALGSLTPAAVGLGATPLASVPVPGPDGNATSNPLAAWCAWLSGPPINCSNPATLAGATLTSATLDGAPVASVPVGSVPVASVPVGSVPVGSVNIAGTPVGSVPLGSVPVGSVTIDRVSIKYSPVGSVPLASVPVASVPLASVPVASVVLAGSPLGSVPLASVSQTICTGGVCTGSTLAGANLRSDLTVGELLGALPAGALNGITLADLILAITPAALHNLTVAQLIASLPTPNTITYADVLALLLQPGNLNWENFDLQATPVQPFATDGGTLAYTADVNLSGGTPGAAADATVHVTTPKGSVYAPGTSTLQFDGVSGPVDDAPPGDPTTLADGSLRWTLHLLVGTQYHLHFKVLAPLTLGPTVASAEVTPTGGTATPAPTDPATTITDSFPANGQLANATPITTDNFYLSHLSAAGDVGLYTFDVPPSGTRTTFHLSHLPADYDLVVYGPSGAQLLPASPSTPPLDGQPLADAGFAPTHATDPLAPQTLDDVSLLSSLPLAGVSTLRGTQEDAVTVVSHGEGGHYTIQVSGFNGASSTEPYMLRAETTAPPVEPGCTPRNLTTATAASTLTTTSPGQDPAAVNTLFVVNDQQFKGIYSDGASTLSTLTTSLPGYAAAGFPAAVVHVDADSGVRTAYSAWNACPGDPNAANSVVSAIVSTLRTARTTYPNAEYIVLVGGDDAIPFARIDDLTTVSNETGYAETFPRATALGGSLSEGKVLTDDPYGTTQPIPFLGSQLFVPDLVVGRLVETPTQINGQLTSFIAPAVAGHLHPASAQTTGYDFLSDGAQGVSTALGTAVASNSSTLIGGTWTASDLTSALSSPADIISINAHADHNRFKPAAGTALVNAADIQSASTTYGGRLIFSMGCHAGLSVFDAFVPTNNLDWAELWASKGAAAYVANTGFGYGDSDTVAYSEDLNVRFAQDAVAGASDPGGAGLTVGEALTVAKQEYKGSLAIVGAYDEKAMAEFTFYGLPMYRIGGSSAPASGSFHAAARQGAAATAPHAQSAPQAQQTTLVAPTPVLGTDAATGLATEALTLDKTFGAGDLVADIRRGSYYQGSDGDIVEHFRPIEPKGTVPISIDHAHGALITGLTSTDVGNFNPVYARPIVDSSAGEPEVGFDDAAFPSKLQAVTTFQRLRTTKQQLVLAQGQFFAASATDGAATGTQRLFSHEAATVFSSTSNDFSPPTFSTLDAQKVGSSVTFALDVTDPDGTATVKRVVVAYKDASGPAWHFLDLANSGGTRWTGSGDLVGTSLQYFAQAVDDHGNVGVSTNKGLYYDATVTPPPTGNVAVTTIETPPANGGWFAGAVHVDVTVGGVEGTPANTQVSVDGGAPQAYSPPLAVSGDGLHTVTATSATGSATTTFLIDTHAPVVSIGAPADGAALFVGQIVTPQFACTDAGIGVASCTASSPTIDTSAPVAAGTFTVTGTDKLGHTTSLTVHYTVKVAIDASVSPASPNGLNSWYITAPTITAEAPKGSVPAVGVVTYTLDAGPSQAYTGPFQLLGDGDHTVVLSAFGVTKTLHVKVDLTSPAAVVTTPAQGAIYVVGQSVTPSVLCSDAASGVASCSFPATVDTATSGSKTFTATATDNAGHQTQTLVNYAVRAPLTVSVLPAAPNGLNGWYTTAPTLTAQAPAGVTPGAGVVTYTVNGGPTQAYTGPITPAADGTFAYVFTAFGTHVSQTIKLDTTKPTVTITSPTATTYAQNQPVTSAVTCIDATSGISAVNCPTAKPVPTTALGPQIFSVTATDNAGNQTTKTVAYTVGASLAVVAAPTTPDGLNGWYKTVPALTVQVPAGAAGPPPAGVVTYSVNTGPFQPYTGPVSPTADGTTNYVFKAYGNTVAKTIKLDRVAPTVTITTPPTGATYARSASVTASFSCADATSLVATCIAKAGPTGGTATPIANGASLDTSATGSYTFTVTGTDNAGNTKTTSTTYTIGAPVPLGPKVIVLSRLTRIFTLDTVSHVGALLTGIPGRDPGFAIDDQATRSPDGTKIAFARRTTLLGPSQIWVIDADGRNPVQLTNTGDNTAPAWNATGTKLAFASNRTGSKGWDIYSGSFSAGALGTLTNLTNATGNDTSPSWSPATSGSNANLIAFASDRNGGQFEIFTMTTSGASQTRITNDPHTDREPAWSPDGTKIAFSSDRAGGAGGFEIYVMGAPNGNSQTRLTNIAGTDSAPFWLSTTQIIFASQNIPPSIFGGLGTVSPTGTALAKLVGSLPLDADPG